VAINLTAASNVAFLEHPWIPQDIKQAEDRAHRIGQKGAVTVYHLIAPDTIDSDMCETLSLKSHTANSVIDGSKTPLETMTETMRLILKRLKK
jgi:SNF2 family DNA or RNA helicase